MAIFSVIGPPIIIRSITSHDWGTCFNSYVNEYSRTNHLQANWVRCGFVTSFVESVITFVAAIALGLKQRWAKATLIIVGAVIAGTILFSNTWTAISFGPAALLRSADTLLFWTAIVIGLSHSECQSFLGLGSAKS